MIPGLKDAAEQIATGSLSSADLTRSCLARIAKLELQVNARQWLDTERARAIAGQADVQARAAKTLAPLRASHPAKPPSRPHAT